MEFKKFKTKKSFKKGGLHTNPDIYWGIFLCIAFLIVIISIVFGIYFFRKISKGLIPASVDDKKLEEVVIKGRIENALEYFSVREQKSTEILNSPSPVADPSI